MFFEKEIFKIQQERDKLLEESKRLRALLLELGGSLEALDEEQVIVSQDNSSSKIIKLLNDMVLIKASGFMMGALLSDRDADQNEKPKHKVTLTRDFLIGKHQVTQFVWEQVMGLNPSEFKGNVLPVENVNWLDCILFCNKLSEQEGLQKVYEIPSGLKKKLQSQVMDQDKHIDKLSKSLRQNVNATGGSSKSITEGRWERHKTTIRFPNSIQNQQRQKPSGISIQPRLSIAKSLSTKQCHPPVVCLLIFKENTSLHESRVLGTLAISFKICSTSYWQKVSVDIMNYN